MAEQNTEHNGSESIIVESGDSHNCYLLAHWAVFAEPLVLIDCQQVREVNPGHYYLWRNGERLLQ